MKTLFTLLVCLFATNAFAADWWGDRPDGGTQYFYTNTLDQDGTAGTPTSEAICVYKDGSNTELTTGATIDDDIDTKTGIHRIAIDTTQSGFDPGSFYTVVYTAGTSDSVSIAERIIGSFRLVVAETTAGIPKGDAELIEGADPDTALASLQDIVDGILDELLSGHTTSGTVGKTLSDILADTAEIGAAGAGLTNIDLPNQTMNITGNITGNLSGSVGSCTAAVTLASQQGPFVLKFTPTGEAEESPGTIELEVVP